MAISDLQHMLKGMEPALAPVPFGIVTVAALPPALARFVNALADKAISANVIAGYYHDHILVQWDRRHDAVAALWSLSNA